MLTFVRFSEIIVAMKFEVETGFFFATFCAVVYCLVMVLFAGALL